MRCKIDFFETVKEHLEKLCQNYNIEVVENSDTVAYLSVFESSEKESEKTVLLCSLNIEFRYIGIDKAIKFKVLV